MRISRNIKLSTSERINTYSLTLLEIFYFVYVLKYKFANPKHGYSLENL